MEGVNFGCCTLSFCFHLLATKILVIIIFLAKNAVLIGSLALKKIIGLCNHESKLIRVAALHCL